MSSMLVVTVLLFSDIWGRSLALPLSGVGNYDDERTDQESLNALVEDNIGGKPLVGGVGVGGGVGGGGGGGVLTLGAFDNRLDEWAPRIIVVSDSGFRGRRTRPGPDRAFSRALAVPPPPPPPPSDPNADHAPGDPRVRVDRRETDLDLLRCMIGRVYRPCWQA